MPVDMPRPFGVVRAREPERPKKGRTRRRRRKAEPSSLERRGARVVVTLTALRDALAEEHAAVSERLAAAERAVQLMKGERGGR